VNFGVCREFFTHLLWLAVIFHIFERRLAVKTFGLGNIFGTFYLAWQLMLEPMITYA